MAVDRWGRLWFYQTMQYSLLAFAGIASASLAGIAPPAMAQTACSPFDGRWILHPSHIAPNGAFPELDIKAGLIKRAGNSTMGGRCTHANGLATLMPERDSTFLLTVKDDEPDKLENFDGNGSTYYQRQ